MISVDPLVNDMEVKGVLTLTQRIKRIYDIAESNGGIFEKDGVRYNNVKPNVLRAMYALTTVEARTQNETIVLSMWRVQALTALISGTLENVEVGVSRNRRKISDELAAFLHEVFSNA